jgi:eukaryotic-like serine/threonine-protein kinase
VSSAGSATHEPATPGGSTAVTPDAAAGWAKLKDLFAEALEKAPASRPEFLAEACGGDAALRAEVESLLRANDQAGRFLDSGARLPMSSQRLDPGTRLGPYEILSLLGAGAMGEVYRAHDVRLGREVAIKVLAVAGHREEGMRRFEFEARAAAALNHPSILAVYDVGTHERNPYIVSEFLRGHTLREALEQERLPLRKAIDYALQLADGISAAHEKGIVHRDLKPENLFVTTAGRLKILDFGIAKLVPERESAPLPSPEVSTQAGTLLGTIGYMSPEQVRGEPADQRSDIFSFGTILYEMLAGERPFTRASPLETAHAIVHEAPPALPDSVPRELAKIVRRCLKNDPSARFQSARDLGLQLTASVPSGAGQRGSRRRRLLPLVLGIGLLAATTGLLSFFGSRGGRPSSTSSGGSAAASIAVLPFADMSAGNDEQYVSDGIAEEILNQLAQVEGLRVVGRTSSFSFRGKAAKTKDIASELNVAHLLNGSVRRDGNRVRISAELVDSAGYRVWSQTYDRELAGVFAMQDEISRAVVDALKVRLAAPHAEIPRRRRTTSPEVYNEYLLGNQFLSRQTYDNYRRALAAYQRAVALDSSFAPPWAGLALAEFWAAEGADSAAALSGAYARAAAAAEKAIAIDPDLAEGYSARGYVRLATFDWQGSRSDFERSLALNPNDAQTWARHAALFAALGRLPDAIAEARKATELEPLWAGSWSSLGRLYYSSGQLGPARAALARALRINPEQSYAPLHLAVVSLLEKRPAEALSFASRSTAEPFRLPVEAAALHDLGRQDEAERKLQELIERFAHFSAYEVAQVYAWFGDRHRAFEWLERAWVKRDPGLANVKFDVGLRNLRSDPRFNELLQKMNLPLD